MKKLEIVLINGSNKELFRGKITSLHLREEIIIKKSIEFFDDDSPCFIHRSAVMKRLFAEVEDYVNMKLDEQNNMILWNELPDSIKDILMQNDEIKAISFHVNY